MLAPLGISDDVDGRVVGALEPAPSNRAAPAWHGVQNTFSSASVAIRRGDGEQLLVAESTSPCLPGVELSEEPGVVDLRLQGKGAENESVLDTRCLGRDPGDMPQARPDEVEVLLQDRGASRSSRSIPSGGAGRCGRSTGWQRLCAHAPTPRSVRDQRLHALSRLATPPPVSPGSRPRR